MTNGLMISLTLKLLFFKTYFDIYVFCSRPTLLKNKQPTSTVVEDHPECVFLGIV